MTWIKLDDDTYAKEANPDPEKIVDADGLQRILDDKNMLLTTTNLELTCLNTTRDALLLEIAELESLIGE